MGRKHEPWPSKALGELDATVDALKALERQLRQAQDAIVLGNDAEALRDLSDGRVMALECVSNLVRARIGKYEQQPPAQGQASQWSKPAAEDKEVQAVARVVATRRA